METAFPLAPGTARRTQRPVADVIPSLAHDHQAPLVIATLAASLSCSPPLRRSSTVSA